MTTLLTGSLDGIVTTNAETTLIVLSTVDGDERVIAVSLTPRQCQHLVEKLGQP